MAAYRQCRHEPVRRRGGACSAGGWGDFADGIMAHEGKWLGGETFVSFDRKVIMLLSQQGEATQLLA